MAVLIMTFVDFGKDNEIHTVRCSRTVSEIDNWRIPSRLAPASGAAYWEALSNPCCASLKK